MRRILILTSLFLAVSASAEDAASVKVGASIFADYVRSSQSSEFDVTRAYINVNATINKIFSARVTPDLTRETGPGSSLNGSLNLRLKFAYAQAELNGSWIRAGLIPLLWTDYEEQFYRYRFQGQLFVDREGYVGTADYGVAGRYQFPHDYGDVAAGVFNGEGFAHAEVNDQKAVMLRASVQPVKGLHLAAFYDDDNYSAGQARDRAVAQVAYEHPRVTAAVDFLSANDRGVKAHGTSIWATPKLSHSWELLLRRDELSAEEHQTRDIEGIAYWVPLKGAVSAAVMLDRDDTRGAGPRITNYGVKLMVSF
jgi:hypothetical protein